MASIDVRLQSKDAYKRPLLYCVALSAFHPLRNETSVVNKLTLHLEIMLTRRLNLSAARGARSISYVGSIDQVLLISLIVAPPR